MTGGRLLAIAGALAMAACGPASTAQSVFNAPVAERRADETGNSRMAVFAGGCFWGVEAVFSHIKGVKSAVAGYHGGARANANYDAVSSGTTNHAEAVKVIYDPAIVTYDRLLQVFFSVVADPTLHNRQGPDIGPQYRAALVPIGDEQRTVAAAYLEQMAESGVWDAPIRTKIEPARTFYDAEAYHQDFARKNPGHPYIRRWDAPKLAALKEMFPSLYSEQPTD